MHAKPHTNAERCSDLTNGIEVVAVDQEKQLAVHLTVYADDRPEVFIFLLRGIAVINDLSDIGTPLPLRLGEPDQGLLVKMRLGVA